MYYIYISWKQCHYCLIILNSPGKGETFKSEEDRLEWEEEQKRLDREWYGLDEGYDDEHNPFSGTSEEYTKKKEEEMKKKKHNRMSAKQRQIHKVSVDIYYLFTTIYR